MDTLKLKKEQRIEKEDQFVSLVNKSKTSTLSEGELTAMSAVENEITVLDKEIAQLETAEKKAAEIVKRQSQARAVGAVQDNASENKEISGLGKNMKISKAFTSIMEGKQHNGVEDEIFQIAKQEAAAAGVNVSGQFAIPASLIRIKKHTSSPLTVGTEGADVVFTEYGGKVIPYLEPNPVASGLGATFMTNLRGNVQWPRETNAIGFAWEGETDNNAETTPTFNNISISPNRVGAYLDVTQQMLKQSVFTLEGYLRSRITAKYEQTIDDALFNGAGSGNEPTGIFNYSGVNVLSLGSSGGDMTYAALLSLIRDTRVADGRVGREGFVTGAYGVHALSITGKQTSGVEGNFIYSGTGPLVGRPLFVTNIFDTFTEGGQSDLEGIIYSSNWGGAIIGTWGGLDILFDPYTQAVAGSVRFVCNAYMDIEIEQAAEFSYCKDWDASDTPALT